MASAPGQIQPACGGMAEGHVGRRIARGCDERRDCAPPTDPDPGVVTPVCERRSANRSATRGRGLVGTQALVGAASDSYGLLTNGKEKELLAAAILAAGIQSRHRR